MKFEAPEYKVIKEIQGLRRILVGFFLLLFACSVFFFLIGFLRRLVSHLL